jgi:hypothetical protein
MANVNSPCGLRPVRYLSGVSWNGATNDYPIASGYNTNLMNGDPVKLVANGTIERAAAGDPILGVFQGCTYSDPATVNQATKAFQQKYWPAGTVADDAMAVVVDDPNVIFEVQASASAAATDVGANADLVAGEGSTLMGISGFQLDSSTIAAGTAQLRILRKVPALDNEWGTNVKLEVLINEHFLRQAAGI